MKRVSAPRSPVASHGSSHSVESHKSLPYYSLEEVAKHNGGNVSTWTIIGDFVYDISKFRSQHPGGDIITLAAGRDSTSLVEAHHSAKALNERLLNILPKYVIGRASNPTMALTRKDTAYIDNSFFETCQSRVEVYLAENNLQRHSYQWIGVMEGILFVVLHIIGAYAKIVHGSILGTILMGITIARMGFLMHMGNHGALGSNWIINKLTGWLIDFVGGNHVVWRHEHQVAHHMDPNIVGKDNDCSIGDPILRFHPDLEHHHYQKYNHILTIVGMTFGLMKWYFSDVAAFFACRIGSVSFIPSFYDWAGLLVSKLGWMTIHFIIPVYLWGNFLECFLLTTLALAIGGHYMEETFIVNHIQKGLVPPTNTHWAVQQVWSTSNWSSGSTFWSIFSGGLNHQIEHHIFPSMSHYLLPQIAPIVQQTCKEFNLPYRNYPNYIVAWREMFAFLKSMGEGPEKSK